MSRKYDKGFDDGAVYGAMVASIIFVAAAIADRRKSKPKPKPSTTEEAA